MGGDYTRYSFKPDNDFSGVFMQQGRVMLDADWNELVEILDRRRRAETMDTIGPAVVPKETPDGFKIETVGSPVSDLSIHPGRIYVHGLLAEHHGAGQKMQVNRLGETPGKDPINYTQQPYLPNAPALPKFPYLVYLDVWQREVTAAEDISLVEKAVGVDTAARAQTVWQVKVLTGIGQNPTCAGFDDSFFAKQEETLPSAGRLSTQGVDVPTSADPCILSPTGGYRGTENRLYRVEVHDGGLLGTATFKWSRNNAALAGTVTKINSTRDELTLESLGRDAVARFKKGDWVEITDDWRTFAGKAGVMCRISDDPDTLQRTIKLDKAIDPGIFDSKDPASRHTLVRRWDQKGLVRDADGKVHENLDGPKSTGAIKVPAAPAASTAPTALILEDGVQVTFEASTAGGKFRPGDYWVFHARTADGSVEELKKAPPRGILHHYCPLAVISSAAAKPTDCRIFWPPDTPSDAGCDCTVCVTPELHHQGKLTIQQAIDTVQKTGGKICLSPGIYWLNTSLEITKCNTVHLVGKGSDLLGNGSVLVYLEPDNKPAIDIENSQDVTLEKFGVISLFRGIDVANSQNVTLEKIGITTSSCGLLLQNVVGATVQHCNIHPPPLPGLSLATGIALEGFLTGVLLCKNELHADTGIAVLTYVITSGFLVENNFIFCKSHGIHLPGFSLHLFETRLSGNFITDASDAGIRVTGAVLSSNWIGDQLLPSQPGSNMDIDGNRIRTKGGGSGLAVGTDDTRIINNDISAVGGAAGGHGIQLVPGLLNAMDPTTPVALREGIDRCQVIGNRITEMGGHGIYVSPNTHIRSAMIKQNVISHVNGGGIVMEGLKNLPGSAYKLSVENNQLLDMALNGRGAAGIYLHQVHQADVAGNKLLRLGVQAESTPDAGGIEGSACNAIRIAGNEVVEIGAANNRSGIGIKGEFKKLEIVDNLVRQATSENGETPNAWRTLRIDGNPPGDRLQADGQSTAVRGNLLEAYGNIPAAEIQIAGACLFSDNRCYVAKTDTEPVVRINAGAAIANGNYLEGKKDIAAMNIHVPAEAMPAVKSQHGATGNLFNLTVLSNIVSGPIEVNTTGLSSPWDHLNLKIV